MIAGPTMHARIAKFSERHESICCTLYSAASHSVPGLGCVKKYHASSRPGRVALHICANDDDGRSWTHAGISRRFTLGRRSPSSRCCTGPLARRSHHSVPSAGRRCMVQASSEVDDDAGAAAATLEQIWRRETPANFFSPLFLPARAALLPASARV